MSSKRVEATLAFMPPKFFTMLPSFMYSPAYLSEAALSLSMSRLHKAEFGFACEIDGLIDALAAQAHLRSGEESAGAAGEAHDHGVVALFNTAKADGQPLLAAQRHVGFGITCRTALGIGIDAEDGEVGIVTRPEPVVLVEAELRDLLGRIDHEADVVVALFEDM